ncbi:G-protein coupled receptor daf-37-like [Liolophura sinensis]|uniref:G-protein coupled receptor daf-37-like n=1 Tax=Liolophura sinensis TaxID=3198878 RepID=UPI00315972EB
MDNNTGSWWANMSEEISNVTETPVSNVSGPKFPMYLLNQYGIYVAGMNLMNLQGFLCCAIGLPSNLASFVTLMKMKPMTSSIFLLTVLAVVDFTVLFYQQLFSILILNFEYRVLEIGCKFYFYIGTILVQYSIRLMVALTVERFIAVWFPLKVANLCTVRRAKITVSCMLLGLALFNIPYCMASSERQQLTGWWICGIHEDFEAFLVTWSWVDSAVYLFLPWPTLLFCNVMIIVGLRSSARKKERMTNSTNQTAESKRQQQSVTVMLIVASVTCFVLLTPNAIFFIYQRYWEFQSDAYQYASYVFVNSFIYFLSNFNHAINFFLYVVSGRRFRRVFIALITCRSTEEGVRGKTSGVTAVSSVSSNWKPTKGVDNGGYKKDEENNI